MTRQRLYLETMERVFGGTDKIILDSAASQAAAGRRALSAAARTAQPAAHGARTPPQPTGGEPMKPNIFGGVVAVILASSCCSSPIMSLFTVYQTRQALVVRLGDPIRTITEPGLHVKWPLIDTVIYVDNRILDLENAAQEVICLRPEAAGGRCLRALSHPQSAAVLPDRQHHRGCQFAALDPAQCGACAACSARRP